MFTRAIAPLLCLALTCTLGLLACGSSAPTCPASSGSAGATCQDSTGCCTTGSVGLVCSANSGQCIAATGLPVGETCTGLGQCQDNTACDGHHFCTKGCLHDADCPSGTACTLGSQGSYICTPGCATKSDCTVYGVIDPNVSGQGLYCEMRTTRDGQMAAVCTY